MTAAERIETALAGGVPDRVPFVPKIWIDLAANLLGRDLLETMRDPQSVLDAIVRVGLDLGIDGVRLFHFPARTVEVDGGVVYDVRSDGTRRGTIDVQGGLHTRLFDAGEFVLEDPHYAAFHHFYDADRPFIDDIRDVRRVVVPDRRYYEEIGCGDRQRRACADVGDRLALIGDCSSATMAFSVSMRTMDLALYDLVDRPELVHAVMEKGTAIAIEKGKFNIDQGLTILRLNDSVGNMSVISPSNWREFIFPHMKEVCDELHAYRRGVRIYCHICGNILPIVEDLVRTGLDCIAPLDPLGGITCAQVRAIVGDSMPLMGGINTLSFLDEETDAIRTEARRCIREAGRRGAFILGSGCVVPRAAKRANILAVMGEVRVIGSDICRESDTPS